MSALGPEAATASLLTRLSVREKDEEISPQACLEAFRPQSTSKERDRVVLRLSRVHNDLAAPLQQALTSRQDNRSDVFAAIRLLTVLFSVALDLAYSLLFEAGGIQIILSKATSAATEDQVLPFITAELLSVASNHVKGRQWLLKQPAENQKDKKIAEIDTEEEFDATAIHWLRSFVEKANIENTSSGSLLSRTALLSSLSLHKIFKQCKEKEMEVQLDNLSTEEGMTKEEEITRDNDDLLFQLCHSHLLMDETRNKLRDALPPSPWNFHDNSMDEMQRSCRLASVEGLAYLTLDTSRRESVISNHELLRQLCILCKAANSSSNARNKTVFPSRTGNQEAATSSYDFDRAIMSSAARVLPDAALQYGLATLLSNVMAYPPALSEEQKQMERLRKMANAKTRVKRAAVDEDDTDLVMSIPAIELRVQKVIDAGGVEALSALVSCATQEGRMTASPAIRKTIAGGFLSMTMRQDKIQRGKIIQHGGARAVLSLSNEWLSDVLQSRNEQAEPSFTSMQALAHLLISEDPKLVLRNPRESIPSLVYLYMHSASSSLQRFEAALALTNLSSLGGGESQVIVSCAFPRKVVETATYFTGAGAKDQSAMKVRIGDYLHERIFLERNEMCRRSTLELLCNLLAADEATLKRWNGEEEDEEEGSHSNNGYLKKGRAMHNLIFLIALTSPVGIDETSGEGGLKIRLAASGAVATLCSSPSTCARLLEAKDRILLKICRLVDALYSNVASQVADTAAKAEEAGDQENELPESELHEQDISQDAHGKEHARLQLALRGLTCLACLVQYVAWLQGQENRDVTLLKQRFVQSGCVDAIKQLALNMAQESKLSTPSAPALKNLREQVTQQSFEALRACKSLGLL